MRLMYNHWLIHSLTFLLSIGLALVIGYQGSWLWLTWQSTANPLPPSPTTLANTASTDVSSPPPQRHLQTLHNAHLFGQPPDANPTAPASTSLEKPPETQLKLTLQGIYYDTKNPASSFAIIADKTYRPQETLQRNVILHQIFPKYLIINRNGRYETLTLVEEQDKLLTTTDSASTAATTESSALLKQYQQQLRTDPKKLLRLLRIAPAYDKGEFLGYRIRAGQDKTLMEKFNLQNGDILTEINGVTLDSPLKGLSMMQELAQAKRLELQLLRDERVIFLAFDIGH